jgi:hypothetical protein
VKAWKNSSGLQNTTPSYLMNKTGSLQQATRLKELLALAMLQ